MTSVQVRYLNADTDIFHECHTVGNIMARVAALHGRFAHEVHVIQPGTEVILNAAAAPPSAVSVILGRDDVESDNDALEMSFLLHAHNKDFSTCLRILERFVPEGERNGRPYLQPDSVLCALVRAGDVGAVEGLMAESVCVNRPGVMTAAAKVGNSTLVRVLLKSADADESNNALRRASKNGHKDIVELLLAAGIRNGDALYHASENGHKDIVKLLLAAGLRDDYALRAASENGHKDIVKLLLAAGIRNDCALEDASENGHKDIVELLLAAGIRDDLPLYAASREGHKDIVELLLAAGIRDDEALRVASERGHKDIVELLLAAGLRDDEALRVASERGHDDIVKLLLAAGIAP